MKYNWVLMEIAGDDELVIEPVAEPTPSTVHDYTLGTAVQITTLDLIAPEDINVSAEDFDRILHKVEQGEVAIIFNEDNVSADVVFKNGLEAFRIPFKNLRIVEEPDFEDTNLDEFLEI